MKRTLRLLSIWCAVFGFIFFVGGIFGLCTTYRTIVRENIITPEDAWIPNTPVRGPLTLQAQSDIIRKHTLATTNGKAYAEMSRDDVNRSLWITATTLTTTLGLGILAYAFSAFVSILGILLLGFAFFTRRIMVLMK